jgi:putative membrane protein
MDRSRKLELFYLLSFLLILLWSAIEPFDRFIWFLEVAPAIAGLLILAATYKSFRLTPLIYGLIWIHAIILVVGGHYTYARAPLFDWIREVFEFQRNNYDKVGHFAQGFIPAMITREVLRRKKAVQSRSWLEFIVVCICLAFSAFYELIEWFVAEITGSAADDFLGTQGYIWDTQSDMALALLGAVLALLLHSRLHDRQLAEVVSPTKH